MPSRESICLDNKASTYLSVTQATLSSTNASLHQLHALKAPKCRNLFNSLYLQDNVRYV